MSDLQAILAAAGWVSLLVGGLVGYGVLKQKVTDLTTWRTEHQRTADEGMARLTRLQTGMSEGAESGFVRVEKALDKVLGISEANATHLATLTGQVEMLVGALKRNGKARR